MEVLYFEEVTERFCGHVVSSNIRSATEEEVETARQLHLQGNCPHTIVRDELGWLYDFRYCVTCGKSLGWI